MYSESKVDKNLDKIKEWERLVKIANHLSKGKGITKRAMSKEINVKENALTMAVNGHRVSHCKEIADALCIAYKSDLSGIDIDMPVIEKMPLIGAMANATRENQELILSDLSEIKSLLTQLLNR